MQIDNVFTFGDDPFGSSATYPLSNYPLSAYRNSWNWGIDTDGYITNYYEFYEYIDGVNDKQLEGAIDWGNTTNTLNESALNVDSWTKRFGVMENTID